MVSRSAEETKAFLLEALDTLFNRRDYEGAARFWSENYVQHSAYVPPGRDGLFDMVRSEPPTLRYDNDLVLVEGDNAILHGRFSGTGHGKAMIAMDRFRLQDGLLAEHWDVLQDEATAAESRSGLPMFGDAFPA